MPEALGPTGAKPRHRAASSESEAGTDRSADVGRCAGDMAGVVTGVEIGTDPARPEPRAIA